MSVEDGNDIAEAITNAVGEWLASQGGGFITAFAASVEYVDTDGDRCWAVAHHDNQSPSQTLGLLRWHTIAIEQQSIAAMLDDDE